MSDLPISSTTLVQTRQFFLEPSSLTKLRDFLTLMNATMQKAEISYKQRDAVLRDICNKIIPNEFIPDPSILDKKKIAELIWSLPEEELKKILDGLIESNNTPLLIVLYEQTKDSLTAETIKQILYGVLIKPDAPEYNSPTLQRALAIQALLTAVNPKTGINVPPFLVEQTGGEELLLEGQDLTASLYEEGGPYLEVETPTPIPREEREAPLDFKETILPKTLDKNGVEAIQALFDEDLSFFFQNLRFQSSPITRTLICGDFNMIVDSSISSKGKKRLSITLVKTNGMDFDETELKLLQSLPIQFVVKKDRSELSSKLCTFRGNDTLEITLSIEDDKIDFIVAQEPKGVLQKLIKINVGYN